MLCIVLINVWKPFYFFTLIIFLQNIYIITIIYHQCYIIVRLIISCLKIVYILYIYLENTYYLVKSLNISVLKCTTERK